MNNEIYRNLHEMLPDFVFNRLNSEDLIFFNKHIEDYPDLVEEINQVKEVFNKFDKMNFNNIINHKSRNLSVKVLENREKRLNYRYSSSQYLFKYLVPIALIISIGLYYTFNVSNYMSIVIDNKLSNLSDSLNKEDFSNELLNYLNATQSDNDAINTISDLYYDDIDDSLSDIINTESFDNDDEYDNYYNSSSFMISKLKDLDENEFQEVYKELQNANLKN